MSDLEKIFLIRSAGQILGPFNKQDVIRLLKQGKISVFDEVAKPFTIWRYLQDHQDFKDVAVSMDAQTRLVNFITSISGKIFTSSQTAKTGDPTVTDTETLEQTQSKKTQDGLALSKLDASDTLDADEAEFEVLERPARPSQARYTSRQDSEEIVRKKIRSVIRIGWPLAVLLVLSMAFYIVHKEFIRPIKNKEKAVQEFKSQGLRLYNAGNYSLALPYFEKAYSKNALTIEDQIRLASLYAQENKTQRAFSLVNELADSSPQSGHWLLLKGLLAFLQEDFSTAEERFHSALETEAHLALVNLALLKWRTKKYKESLSYLDQLTREGYERDIVFYLRALNLLAQNQMEELISHIGQELEGGRASLIEYRPELYLILAYFYMREQKPEKLKQAVRSLLNEDPFFGAECQYSSFIASKSADWTDLYPYCKSVFNFAPQDNLLNALYGFCLLKTGQLSSGSKRIEQAKNREPEKPLFLSLYAYSLMLEGRGLQLEQVFDVIDYDRLSRRQTLPFILKAKFLEEKQDWIRALSAWEKLLALDSRHLSGMAGMAVVNYKLGHVSAGDVYRDKVLSVYPHHTPLLSHK